MSLPFLVPRTKRNVITNSKPSSISLGKLKYIASKKKATTTKNIIFIVDIFFKFYQVENFWNRALNFFP